MLHKRSSSGIKKKPITRFTSTKKPHLVKPMLATLVDKPFDNDAWIFEIKLDGFRAMSELNNQQVELYSRNHLSLATRFPKILTELKRLKLDAVLDGEIVVLDAQGVSRFQLIQNQDTLSQENSYFYVFDLLYLNGEDLSQLPLIERKRRLKKILKKQTYVRYLDHVEEQGIKFFQLCRQHGCEGIIGKKKESRYQFGQRSRDWVKIKASMQQEVVICGFTEPKASRKDFGALIVGVYQQGILTYAGHVGGGFSMKQLRELRTKLEQNITSVCPFKTKPKTNTAVTWVKPKYVCEVKFQEWTKDKIMRQPIFLGLREDKKAKTVIQEVPKKSKKTAKLHDFITNPDKIYWPKEKITKGELLAYYETVAPVLLFYLKDRPQSLKRFPNGITGHNFFQKNLATYPQWISTFPIQHHDRRVNYMLIQNTESLLYAVNLGCIELHPWFSRIQSLENPDFLTFDLDPEDIPFEAVIETAQALHAILDALKVPNLCKTSGASGLHVSVPLMARYDYEQAKQFALLIASFVNKELPTITSLERSPKKRQKKVYIDCFQNNFGQTLIAPYSVRAKPGAPVATPLEWGEVEKRLNPLDFNMFNTAERLNQKGDIFHRILGKGIDLSQVLKRMQKIQF